MKTYILEYKEDQEMGGMGFYIHGATMNGDEYNMATDGLLVAHDILEHQRIKDIGSIGDELKAMGAIWYVRAQFGDFKNRHIEPAKHLASEITRMARDYFYSPYIRCKVPVKREHWLHEEFNYIIDMARDDLKHELDNPEEWNSPEVDKYFATVMPLMIEGFQHAEKRFNRIGGAMAANRLFHAIECACDNALGFAEYEGQRFKLHVDFLKGSAVWEECYDEEEDY